MITTILFDLDGTIIDTNELIIASFLHALEGIVPPDFTREHIIPEMGKPLTEQMQRFAGRDAVEDLVVTYRAYMLDRHDEMMAEFPAVKEVLEGLRDRGIRMGVVTTKARLTTEKALHFLGLYEYMEVIVTIDDVTHPKPHPEPVEKALLALGADPARTAMVGDSMADILSAQRAGVTAIGVAWSMKGADYLRSFNPDHIIHEMADLLELVADIAKEEEHE
ncbi:pyrophosphatase [Paenibacillus swuensis]|uniref:Pyrophosphatase n=1 Tax=Paenibacillus swuensis TaxID=1178515 RepID=A0A172TIZ2_9BACL|nr:pyrophosphatase PpaX [Paenibacillus swuensis]ANE46827.1 pyrophosphatase [Paenibacillus swuensis]